MEEVQKTVQGTVFPMTEFAAGLGEGQIAKLVADDDVEAGQIRHAALFAAADLDLQPVHQIDDVEETAQG